MKYRWYPYFFLLFPALFIARAYWVAIPLAEIAGTVLILALAFGVVYELPAYLLRNRVPGAALALSALAVVLWFYAYPTLHRLVTPAHPAGHWHVLLMTLGGLITGAGLAWMARQPRYLKALSRLLTLAGSLLVLWNGALILLNASQGGRAVAASGLARRLAAEDPGSGATPSDPEPRRDVYLLLLDEHAGAQPLREVTGFDNTAFEDSLRQLGLMVPRVVHNNYAHTMLSLPSLLNFAHLTELGVELGPDATSSHLPDHLLQHNRAARFLRSRGYEVVFLPSQWWPPTWRLPAADVEVNVWERPTLRQRASRGLTRFLWPRTALSLLGPAYAPDADFVRRTLEAIRNLPRGDRPRFVIAHVISPHEPYVLDRSCRVKRHARQSDPHGAYIEQIQCLDRMLLELVRSLLERSEVAPIILLQGDHGTGFRRFASVQSVEDVSLEQARERFGAFGAYYLPAGGGAALGDTLTLVNLFPIVFNHYFATELPMAPNDLFMSVDEAPFRFRRFRPAALAPMPPRQDIKSLLGRREKKKGVRLESPIAVAE